MNAAAQKLAVPAGVEIRAEIRPGYERVLSEEALAFVAELERHFGQRRRDLLAARVERQKRLDAGEMPDFLPHTKSIRDGDWTVAPLPKDLLDRRVEITGPVDRKMVINALNSGASVFMADFEDSSTPVWHNMIDGQNNMMDATRGISSEISMPGTLVGIGRKSPRISEGASGLRSNKS